MRPVKTIRHILPSPKDLYTAEDKSCVVYQIPCSDCDYVYIGQTKRGLKLRLADYRRATSQLRPELSALCKHAMDLNHTIDWEKSEMCFESGEQLFKTTHLGSLVYQCPS